MSSFLLPKSEFHNPVLKLKNIYRCEAIENIAQGFRQNKSNLEKIMTIFSQEIDKRLDPSSPKNSFLMMSNKFASELQNKSESGNYLSLDLGSTNFRVVLSQFRANNQNLFEVKFYDIPKECRRGESKNLFDFIASCIASFMKEFLPENSDMIPLGFTFSFPVIQKSINIAILETWTKDFDCPDAVGTDVVLLLQEAIARRNDINVDIVAILNDATGTLVQGIYLDSECAISLIVGTGSNACYLEKIEKLERHRVIDNKNYKEVIINTEFGTFGDNGCMDFIKTEFDLALDKESLFPQSFSFEKLFSGQFVGDVVRRVLIYLAKKELIFEGKISDELKRLESFTSEDISHIEGVPEKAFYHKLSERLGYEKLTEEDIEIIKYLCAIVSVRAALLLAAIISTLVDHIDRPHVTIAVDGSVYKYHSKLHKLLIDFIHELIPSRNFRLILAEDGSGKGAGLVAAIAQRQRSKNL